MKRLFFIFILLFSQLSFAELEDYIFEKKEEKNKIRISQELRVTTLDPIKLTDIYSKRAFRFIYDTLFEIDIDGKITPKLAQEYYYITKKLLYIKLKDGIKFQDGTSLTSEDVKNSLLRVKTQGALKEFYKNIEEIEIINNREFIIKFSQEDKYIFETLSHTMSSIIKEKAGKIIGTGLYQVEALQKDSVTLSNIEFPYKKIIIDRIFSIQDRLLSLFNNNSDVIYDITNFDIKNGKNLKIIDEKNIDIKKSENIVTTALVFNKNRDLFQGYVYDTDFIYSDKNSMGYIEYIDEQYGETDITLSTSIKDKNLDTGEITQFKIEIPNSLKSENEVLKKQLDEKDKQISELHKLIENSQILLKEEQKKSEQQLYLAEHFEEVDNKLQDLKEKMEQKRNEKIKLFKIFSK